MKKNIPSRSRNCVACKTPFLPGRSYYTQLTEEHRLDFCKECYQPKDDVLFWEGFLPTKQEIDPSVLQLFGERYQEGKKSVIFILALYLERTKQLVRRSSQGKMLLFEEPISGKLFSIEPMVLTKKEESEVKTELASWL